MPSNLKILQLKTYLNFLNKEVEGKTEVDDAYTKEEVDALLDAVGVGGGVSLSDVYPVGSIYIELTGTNPNTTFGFGTWVAFGAGRVPVGYDSGDTDFDTAEEEGGAKTKSISAHAGTAVANHADHVHGYGSGASANAKIPLFAQDATTGAGQTGNTSGTTTLSHSVTQPSAHDDLNVVQPYITVHMWKRTA